MGLCPKDSEILCEEKKPAKSHWKRCYAWVKRETGSHSSLCSHLSWPAELSRTGCCWKEAAAYEMIFGQVPRSCRVCLYYVPISWTWTGHTEDASKGRDAIDQSFQTIRNLRFLKMGVFKLLRGLFRSNNANQIAEMWWRTRVVNEATIKNWKPLLDSDCLANSRSLIRLLQFIVQCALL